jgi:hypothetical protein
MTNNDNEKNLVSSGITNTMEDNDALVKKYCDENSLDYECAADYARAAIAVLKYELPLTFYEVACNGNTNTIAMLSSNQNNSLTIVTDKERHYNQEERINERTTRRIRFNEYGIDINDLKRKARKFEDNPEVRKVRKQSLKRKLVRNDAEVKIGIAGKGLDEKHSPKSVYLWPTEVSDKYLYDTDAVLILPGQKYYKANDRRDKDNIVTSGAIKVKDSVDLFKAVVKLDTKDAVLYVDSFGTEYYTQSQADALGWHLP